MSIASPACNRPSVFNSERARLAGLKSVQVRRLKALAASAQSVESSATVHPTVQTDSPPEQDSFTSTTLSRVRDQMSLLADMMKKEKDPARLDRLAAAFGKLAEVERQLAGRPLPGSLRPTNRPAAGGMIEQPQSSTPGSSAAPTVKSDDQE